MSKKRIRVLICIVVILLLAGTYFFQFTLPGQKLLYSIFGGKNLHLVSQDKELFWFDVQHSNDPNSPMYRRIEKAFEEFSPDLVLVEGGYNSFEGDRESAIYNGESAFTTYLSKQAEIPVEDIEPPFHLQIEYLQSKYPPKDILAMYLIRQISSEQFAHDNSQTDFHQLVLDQAHFCIDNGLDYNSESLEDILEVVNSFLPEPINKTNWRDVDIRAVNYVYTKENGSLYPIYNDIYNYRNIYLMELLKEKSTQYNRTFIVMGGTHLAELKEQLQQMYTK